jgi:hypothetical protein
VLSSHDAVTQVFSNVVLDGLRIDLMTVMVALIGLALVLLAMYYVLRALESIVVWGDNFGGWYKSLDEAEGVNDVEEAKYLGEWLEEAEGEIGKGRAKYDYVFQAKKHEFNVRTKRIGKRWAK